MLKRLVNLAKGEVTGRVESGFPERVLNICAEYGIVFWDLRWASPVEFTFTMTRRDWKRLRRLSRRIDCDMTAVNWKGAPFFLGRIRRRYGLWVTLGACVALLFWGSFFIWDFQVEGNVNVSRQEILRALEKHGVGFGTYGLDVDSPELRNYILLDLPELSYIAVNVRGCRAEVQVRERTPAPVMVDRREPSNLVARRAGLVKKVQTIGGVACVIPGSAVTEGQILISGIEDTDTVGARVLAGMGKVEARTWYHLTASMPLTVLEKQYTGREKTGLSLIFGSRRIKFFSNSSIDGAEYDKIINRISLNLLGVPLPVTVEAETWRFYEAVPTARTAAQAEKAAEAILTAQLQEMVEPYGEVKSTLCASRQKGDVLAVTLSAECLEEIGETAPIYTEEETG